MPPRQPSSTTEKRRQRSRSEWPFFLCFALIGGVYVLLILALLLADARYTSLGHIFLTLGSDEIRHATWLSLISCSITTILSLWVSIPLGYLLSRWNHDAVDRPFRSLAALLERTGLRISISRCLRGAIDAIIDIPIVLPPLVIGLSLLILMRTAPGRWFEAHVFQITFEAPSIVLAQFSVACAFAVRTMRVTFDQISPRAEQVAMTLGCGRAKAFWLVALPESRRGVLAAATLAWARSLGEFGPILIFSGATRMRTEVLPTSVYLELSVGNLESAVAVSILMVVVAVVVLIIVRLAGSASAIGEAVRP